MYHRMKIKFSTSLSVNLCTNWMNEIHKMNVLLTKSLKKCRIVNKKKSLIVGSTSNYEKKSN